MQYPFLFSAAKEGGWVITCRDLPEAISQAEKKENRIEVAEGCLQAAIEARMRLDMEIPAASPATQKEVLIAPPLGTAAKAALYQSMREAHVNKSELARLLGVDEKEVRRMLDTRHATKIPRLEQAARVLGCRMVIDVERVAA